MPYGTFPMTMNGAGERGDERNGRNIVENREKAGRSRVYKGHKRKGESRVSSLEVVYDYDSPLHISGSTWRSCSGRERKQRCDALRQFLARATGTCA